MVGLLGCGCCGPECDCGNNNIGAFFEQFNSKPAYDYQLLNLTDANVTSDSGRLQIKKKPQPGNIHRCTTYVLPSSKFQKLDRGFGNNRFPNPCLKKISASIDYEIEPPGKSAFSFPFSYREMIASVALVSKETNFSNTNNVNRYVGMSARSIVYSNQPSDSATNTITATAGTFGGSNLTSVSFGGFLFNKGTFTLSCEFTGIRTNGTVQDWLWRFKWNGNELYTFNANVAKIIGWGEICDFDIVFTGSFFSNNFSEIWQEKKIWFDNLKVEHFVNA